MKDEIILVDENDKQIGTGEKMAVHMDGKLHRAFSVFIFNSLGDLMIQKRASKKYHCGGLWTNTCCSHPRPGETSLEAALRRLEEEMGFFSELSEVFSFIYNFRFENGLSEHEYDHVFVGYFDGEPIINPEEVEAWQWAKISDLLGDIKNNENKYTPWFLDIIKNHLSKIKV